MTRRTKSLGKAFDDMLESIIADHEQDTHTRIHEPHQRDFIDAILSINSQHSNTTDDMSLSIDRTSLKAVLVDLIVGAADASATSIEWVLSALIRHPRVMKKLRQEVKEVVGDKTFVDESDLPKLCYLHMVIKETFRLYPTAPLLVPRKSVKDVLINGYNIPEKTLILVNFWAFGRDSKVWSDNWDEFLPERFLDKAVDLRGQDFELIPFGSGRRGCPGMNLGLVNTGLVVSNLVHSFNWDLPNGMLPADLDMSERFGLSMPRAKPLLAIPTYRL